MDSFDLRVTLEIQEKRIDLDHVHFQLMQHIQRGITASEVVHQDQKSLFPELHHGLPYLLGILRAGGFGDLDLQRIPGQMIFDHQLLKKRRNIDGKEVHLGDIQRYRDQRISLIQPGPDPGRHLTPHILIQVCDKTVFFQHRNKDTGRYHGPVLLPPPG